MAEVGVLRSVLTASDTGFSATLNTGAAKAQSFGKTINSGTRSFVNFNAKALESRKAIGTLAAASNTSAGQILHLIHAFGVFGVYAGTAVATVLVLKEVFDAFAESQKRAAERNAQFSEKFRELRNSMSGIHETEGMKNLREIGGEFSKLRTDIMNTESAAHKLKFAEWIGGPIGFGIKKYREMLENELNEMKSQRERMKGLYGQFKTGMGGFMERHIGQAVQGRQLGVMRLEHTMQARQGDPLLTEAQKQTALLQQLADRKMAQNGFGEMNSERRQRWGSFTGQAGL